MDIAFAGSSGRKESAVTADKEAGTAYLKPTTDKPTLSLFVSDENGRTWKLLCPVIDGPRTRSPSKSISHRHGLRRGKDVSESADQARPVVPSV